jgi:hypothetical protein
MTQSLDPTRAITTLSRGVTGARRLPRRLDRRPIHAIIPVILRTSARDRSRIN